MCKTKVKKRIFIKYIKVIIWQRSDLKFNSKNDGQYA